MIWSLPICELGTIIMRLFKVRILVDRMPMSTTFPQDSMLGRSIRSPMRYGRSTRILAPEMMSAKISRLASERARPTMPRKTAKPVMLTPK